MELLFLPLSVLECRPRITGLAQAPSGTWHRQLFSLTGALSGWPVPWLPPSSLPDQSEMACCGALGVGLRPTLAPKAECAHWIC